MRPQNKKARLAENITEVLSKLDVLKNMNNKTPEANEVISEFENLSFTGLFMEPC